MGTVAELTVVEWHRLNKLLEHALGLEPEERRAWLAGSAVDEHLRAVLVSLLERADSGEANVLEESLWQRQGERPGDLIGPYQLMNELAVGGMGVVWIAERADGSFNRRVALKLPRAEWAAPGLAERMARERSILASLIHPSIAQLFDAGWSQQGRPYLAIELVDGVPINLYCTQHRLPVRRRVELFLEAVRAVAFAHTRLVVHRDLKPANVMVTNDGHVKLLDFGIAKLLVGDEVNGEETALTRLGGRALTLGYAAPEQVLGRPVSAATDVYALGVMLHELLSGARLYGSVHSSSQAALEQAIVHVEPEPPSRAATADRRAVRGDLDTIVLKALRKAPERRYHSAAELAEDLERYLTQQPIRARPDSRSYRTRMFVSRHRLPVAAAAALATAIVVGALASLWQAQTAREEARRADAIKEFVLSIIRQADPLASAATREADTALLATAEARIVDEMNAQPRMVLEVRLAIAEAYANRGQMDRARATLRSAIKDGKERLDTRDPLVARAVIAASQNFMHAGDHVLKELDQAIDTARRLGPSGRRLLVEGLVARASQRHWVADAEKTSRDLLEAYELSRAAFGPSDPLTLTVACAIAWPGPVQVDQAAVIRDALAVGRADPRLSPSHPTLLRVQALHGYYLAKAGKLDEAVQHADDAVDVARRRHGESRPTEEVMTAALLAYIGARRLDRAMDVAQEALGIAERRFPDGDLLVSLRATNVVSLMVTSRRVAGAEELIAKRKGKESLVDDELRMAGALYKTYWTGLVRQLQGRTSEAEAMLKASVAGFEARELGRTFAARIPLAWALRENGRPAEALEALRAVNVDALVWDDDRLAALNELAASHLELGHAEEALRFSSSAVAADRSEAPFTPHGADAHMLQGRALLALGRLAPALSALEVADAFWRRFDPNTAWAAEASYWHGVALVRGGESGAGQARIAKALPALRASPMPSHRALALNVQ